MKKLALFLAVLMLGCSTAAQAQMAATRDAQYIAVLRAVVNYKIDDDENIRNIERLREDRRFNEKVQKMLDKLSNERSKKTTNRRVLQILEQAGKDLYNLLD